MANPTATEIVKSLSVDELRQRLFELGNEQKALRVLLRAAIRAHEPRKKPPRKPAG